MVVYRINPSQDKIAEIKEKLSSLGAKEIQEEIGKRTVKVREKDEIKEMKILNLIAHLRKIVGKPIEQGYSYIIKDEKPDKAYDVFRDLIKEGYDGIILSEGSPKKIEKKWKKL